MALRPAHTIGVLLAAFLGLPVPVHAFNCAPTEGEECRLTIGPLTIAFLDGVYSFDGDSQLNGQDGYVTGYTVGTHQFPDLTPLDLGQGRLGFEFAPGMAGAVGGSGFAGEHEASATFAFTRIRLEPAPGWQVMGQELSITGERRTVGNGIVVLNLHGTPSFDGDRFVSLGSAPADNDGFGAGFSTWTVYEEDGDGGAASYGTAYARFDSVRFMVQLAPVDEPATGWMALAGVLALAARLRGRT